MNALFALGVILCALSIRGKGEFFITKTQTLLQSALDESILIHASELFVKIGKVHKTLQLLRDSEL